MKKILLLLFVIAATGASAQEFKKFKFGIGLAPAIYLGGNPSFGTQLYFEPTFRITDKLAVSYKADVTARFAGGSFGANNAVVPFISNSFNGQYYFSNGTFRPFVGFGLGLFTNFDYDFGFTRIPASSNIGFYPRFGFDLSHFNLSIDYNIVGGSKYTSVDPTGFFLTTSSVNNSYLAIRFGISIGGGKIK